MSDLKTKLLVTGVAHSGLADFAQLLNTHEDICLGVERFRFELLTRAGTPDLDSLFSAERFRDFRSTDTHNRPDTGALWADHYEDLAERWETARIVGDCLSDLTPRLDSLLRLYPDLRVVFLLRNLKDVAMDWQDRPDAAGSGFVSGCQSWARQYEMLHDLMRNRHLRGRILLVNFDTMFLPEAETSLEAMLQAFLGIQESAAFDEACADFATNVGAASSAQRVPEEFVELYKSVGQDNAKALRRVAASFMP